MTCPRKIFPYGELDFAMDEEREAATNKKRFTPEQIIGKLRPGSSGPRSKCCSFCF
jgi:hypothetical protein